MSTYQKAAIILLQAGDWPPFAWSKFMVRPKVPRVSFI